ncbi:MAG: cobalt-precorrin-5B (C(1))-methyltransferase CbiD [Lachnospiraceae bacterium]|nr:cobalt-precorrin-5B (C(1))-methyltransferase CbiD [Lachnospiraceae bacterium]
MKETLREGVSTGSCMTAGALASVIWQTTGKCPSEVAVETPIGKTLYIEVAPAGKHTCVVIKDAGDDPDVTNGCQVVTKVEIGTGDGPIEFFGGEGIGTITQEGLKIEKGNPAINPVPRQMVEKELRKIIGAKSAKVTVSIPGGEEIAKKTFNPRLGIVGGLSILGTTGIVRPMSEEAMKDSLRAELTMYQKQGHKSIVFVLGTTGENALKAQYGDFCCVLQVSNYIGDMLDEACEMGFTHILIGGFVGKLVKVAGGTMNTHSHISDGRMETICTHAALAGADKETLLRILNCVTTRKAEEILEEKNLTGIWKPMADRAADFCMKRTGNQCEVAMVFLDSSHKIMAESDNTKEVLSFVLKARGKKHETL